MKFPTWQDIEFISDQQTIAQMMPGKQRYNGIFCNDVVRQIIVISNNLPNYGNDLMAPNGPFWNRFQMIKLTTPIYPSLPSTFVDFGGIPMPQVAQPNEEKKDDDMPVAGVFVSAYTQAKMAKAKEHERVAAEEREKQVYLAANVEEVLKKSHKQMERIDLLATTVNTTVRQLQNMANEQGVRTRPLPANPFVLPLHLDAPRKALPNSRTALVARGGKPPTRVVVSKPTEVIDLSEEDEKHNSIVTSQATTQPTKQPDRTLNKCWLKNMLVQQQLVRDLERQTTQVVPQEDFEQIQEGQPQEPQEDPEECENRLNEVE